MATIMIVVTKKNRHQEKNTTLKMPLDIWLPYNLVEAGMSINSEKHWADIFLRNSVATQMFMRKLFDIYIFGWTTGRLNRLSLLKCQLILMVLMMLPLLLIVMTYKTELQTKSVITKFSSDATVIAMLFGLPYIIAYTNLINKRIRDTGLPGLSISLSLVVAFICAFFSGIQIFGDLLSILLFAFYIIPNNFFRRSHS